MEFIVKAVAPVGAVDFVVKLLVCLVLWNLLAIAVVFGMYGTFSSGLRGQLIETTAIGLLPAFLSLKVIQYQHKLQTKLAELAATDMLTGLRNRRAFLADVEQARPRHAQSFVLLADVDFFKRINDTYGHEVGDVCLEAVAKRLRGLEAENVIVGRLGGEEFGLCYLGATRPDAAALSDAVCAPIELQPDGVPADIRMTLSVGCAIMDDTRPLKEVIACADRALYDAKAAGRARAVIVSEPWEICPDTGIIMPRDPPQVARSA
ncbi:GGDEF domain-containing protein [Yoonia sp. R2331]|uniref:GGDEF domain-containing protein n=1 Tax=Yoonia sp. R2331 TaxID=3237238 RepID=UPI0034E5A94F